MLGLRVIAAHKPVLSSPSLTNGGTMVDNQCGIHPFPVALDEFLDQRTSRRFVVAS